jgi:hypothetical protein
MVGIRMIISLRAGYRSLHRRPNTTHVTVEPGDNLTVVGDLHGRHLVSANIAMILATVTISRN